MASSDTDAGNAGSRSLRDVSRSSRGSIDRDTRRVIQDAGARSVSAILVSVSDGRGVGGRGETPGERYLRGVQLVVRINIDLISLVVRQDEH